MCVPSCNNGIHEMLDVHRDLHANNFGLREEYPFGTGTLLLAFPFSSEREWIALRSMLGVTTCHPVTLSLSASVSWQWDCVLV